MNDLLFNKAMWNAKENGDIHGEELSPGKSDSEVGAGIQNITTLVKVLFRYTYRREEIWQYMFFGLGEQGTPEINSN